MNRGFVCLQEISREITLEAQKQGVNQLFLSDPLAFSERLLQGRKQQYLDALGQTHPVFFDRGIPDIEAYMNYKKEDCPQHFTDACENCVYNVVFILKPWHDIYKRDNERYEDFHQAVHIHEHLQNTYTKYGYTLLEVPFNTIENRTDFILKTLNIR